MARKTNSIVLYSQIIGRGLRGPVIGGTDTCEIYTVFDNILDLPSNNDIYSYFEEYFELKKVSIQSTYNGAGGYTIFSEYPEIIEGGLYTKDLLNYQLQMHH